MCSFSSLTVLDLGAPGVGANGTDFCAPAAPVTITYTYDPLNRLTGADYSTGESFEYQYDAVGNRTAMTATQGVAGTTVTT